MFPNTAYSHTFMIYGIYCSKFLIAEGMIGSAERKKVNYQFCDGITHTVKKGDTLYGISRMHNVPLSMLLKANPYVDVFNLQVGDTICVPASKMNEDTKEVMPGAVNRMQRENEMMPETEETTSDMVPFPVTSVPAGNNRRMTPAMQNEEDNWKKYVVQPGDTMENLERRMDGDWEMFFEKNGKDKVYLLPGVAYYLYTKK